MGKGGRQKKKGLRTRRQTDRSEKKLDLKYLFLWSGLWLIILFFIFSYVQKELNLRSSFVINPASYISTLMQQGSGDEEAISTEAEDAIKSSLNEQTRNNWSILSNANYSNYQALYTNTEGSQLFVPVSLSPGTYRVMLAVWAYETVGENKIDAQIGNNISSFTWNASKQEKEIPISLNVRLDKPADHITLTASKISQPFLVIDKISFSQVSSFSYVLIGKITIYLLVLGAVFFLLLSSLAWGVILLRLFNLEIEPLLSLIFAAALGLGFIGTTTTILGILGSFRLIIVVIMLLLGIIIGGWELLCLLREWFIKFHETDNYLFFLSVLFIGVIVIIASAPALAPAVGVDPQIYHLPIAKWLIKEGRFTYHPYQIPWAYPHLISNLFAVGQLIYNDTYFRTAQAVHAMLGLLWLITIYAMGKKMFGRAAGIGAAFLCLGIEGVIVEFGLGLVDLGFAFFASASILVFILIMIKEDENISWRHTLLAAILAGFAAVCKVNGPSIAICIAVACAVLAGIRSGWKHSLQCFLIFGAVSLIVAFPMYFKNYLVYGNPLYSFTTIFSNRDLSPAFIASWVGHDTWNNYVLSLGKTIVAFWPYYWVNKQFVDPLSPGPGILVSVLLIAVMWWHWLKRFWPLLLSVALLILFWFFISPLTRFAWPWLGVLLVFACAPLSEKPLKMHRVLVSILLIVSVIPTIAGELCRPVVALNNVVGYETDEHYLSRALLSDSGKYFVPPLDGLSQLNRIYNANPSNERVLLDTNLVAYADFPSVPVPYYIMAESIDKQHWSRLDGPICLSLSGKICSDSEMFNELVGRLNVHYILIKKDMPKPPASLNGKYYDSMAGMFLLNEQDLFNNFITRWVQEGLATKKDFTDSSLYILNDPGGKK